MIINDLKLSNVVVLLHDSQEFKENLWNGSEKDLFFSFSFSIYNSSECVGKDVDFDHFCGANKYQIINILIY